MIKKILFLLIPFVLFSQILIQPVKYPGGGGDDYADLTMFWRCEGTTLGAGDTYGTDNTATLNSQAAINTDAANIGTNGLDCPSSGDYASFTNNADYIVGTEGRHGRWVRFTDHSDGALMFLAASAGDDHSIRMTMSGTDELAARWVVEFEDDIDIVTTDANLSTGTWYFVELKWNSVADSLQILVDGTSRAVSTAAMADWGAAIANIFFGEGFAVTSDAHYDNIMLSNDSARNLYAIRNETETPKP